MEKTSSKPVIAQSMAQAAKLLKVHVSEVKRAKRSGCRAFMRSGRIHLEKLRKWLAQNRALPAKSKSQPAPRDLSTLAMSLTGVIEVEQRTLQLLQDAQLRGDALAVEALTAAYNRSQRNRLLAEKDVRRQMQEAKELIPKDVHERALRDLWIPIVNGFRLLPRKLSPHLATVDEVQACRIVEEGVEGVFAEIRKTFGKSEPEADEMRVSDWVNGMLQIDPTGSKTLEQIEDLRSRVVALVEKQVTAKSEKTPSFTSETAEKKTGSV
jgi:hypothetical protein